MLVGTNDYNFIWEHVFAHRLGTDFDKVEKFIGTCYEYEGMTPKVQFELYYVNTNNHIIVDSKYYYDLEGECIDYKQLSSNILI